MAARCPFCNGSDGSGGRAPSFFDVGLAILTVNGVDEKTARNFLGKLASEYGKGPTAAAVGILSTTTPVPIDPQAYLMGVLKQHPSRNGTKTGAHTAEPWRAEWIRQLTEEIDSDETGLARRDALIAFRSKLPSTLELARERYKEIGVCQNGFTSIP